MIKSKESLTAEEKEIFDKFIENFIRPKVPAADSEESAGRDIPVSKLDKGEQKKAEGLEIASA